ncbi:MAG: VPLPA-CTERM sorting domain-containing protein [Pseudomonadota bacterium]
MKIMQVALLCAGAIGGQVWAAPVFQIGVDNNLGFQSVANNSGGPNQIAVGDLYYGVINVQDIANTATGTTSWNANNVSSNPPIDSFSGYFVTQVTSVTATSTPLGTIYTAQLGVASSDPNGVFSAAELSAGTMMKLYTDTSTAYTTGGPVATDIAHATDGNFWASLGFAQSGDHWGLVITPTGFAATGSTYGGLDFINNNSGLTWNKVLDTTCDVSGGCMVSMKFASTFSQATAGGAWQTNINDPATLQPVPLPAAGWLMGSGLLALVRLSSKRKNRATTD